MLTTQINIKIHMPRKYKHSPFGQTAPPRKGKHITQYFNQATSGYIVLE